MKLDELLKDRGRVVNHHTVPVLMDRDAAQRCVRAEEAAEKARDAHGRAVAIESDRMAQPQTTTTRNKLDEAEAELEAAYQAAEPHLVEFKFESVGGDLWDQMITAHPPTVEQRERDENAEYDPTVFPLAAIAVSLADPEIPDVEIDAYRKALDRGESDPPIPPAVRKLKSQVPSIVWDQLFSCALLVNRGVTRVPLLWSGSGTTRRSGNESAQQ